MADGWKNIPRCQKGDRSLVEADYANMLIDLANALGNGRVAPIANVGKFMLAGGQYILDLSLLDARLRAVEAGGGGGATNVGALPFGINDTSPNANFASVNVRFGTVGNNTPAGVSTDINLTIPNSNTCIYLNVTIDNNAGVTAGFISTGNSVPSDNSTKAYRLIGNVAVLNNVVTIDQALLFSQEFVACDRNTADIANTPGTYHWQVA
jgi:hypothetical protein